MFCIDGKCQKALAEYRSSPLVTGAAVGRLPSHAPRNGFTSSKARGHTLRGSWKSQYWFPSHPLKGAPTLIFPLYMYIKSVFSHGTTLFREKIGKLSNKI